ncbi:cytochrome P450 6k1 isoform X1 [Pieris rapae]|uniref:cytochrome P450 6k1 isoform X1 n=1 Tax=Pieris rapae TaxID=64459 RepID=UPI001E2814EA|nr:cytochrome P450 6k1 isoform X1 [Pieris rapae]
MFQLILSVFIVCFISWVYLRWRNVRDYWARRGVPHLPPHPLMGSLTFLQQKNPALWMIDMYKQFNTPYVGIWLFWKPAVIINSPEIAKNVLVKDFSNFRDRFLRLSSNDPAREMIFTVKHPLWSSIRRNLSSVFTSAKLKSMQTLFDTKIKELNQRINNTKEKSKINIRMLCTDYSTDVITAASLGIQTTATLSGEDPVRSITKELMDYNWYRGICWSTIFFYPKLANLFRFQFFPTTSTKFFDKILQTVTKQRLREKTNFNESKDLLDALITLKDGLGNEEEYSDDVVLAQAISFIFGGFETSGSTLSFALYELTYHPDIQEKLYRELNEAKKSQDLDIGTLHDLKYLNCIIKETLRKYPPLGWLDRVAVKDYKIDDKLTIPAGTPIYVNAVGMHYDSDLYPDPETFDPDRFLPNNEKDIKQFTFMPFGEGPRSCIGRRFGEITIRSALSSLVLNYKLIPVSGQLTPSEMEYEKRGLILSPGRILHIDFKQRDLTP